MFRCSLNKILLFQQSQSISSLDTFKLFLISRILLDQKLLWPTHKVEVVQQKRHKGGAKRVFVWIAKELRKAIPNINYRNAIKRIIDSQFQYIGPTRKENA